MLALVVAIGLQLGRQHGDELAHLPQQRLRVARLVHVVLFPAAEANDGAGVKQPHPDRNADAQPRRADALRWTLS
ncbi:MULTISPECIES: hypothetical protein [Burkholderia]|uniref:hypothetical protein n=1 Tax=Burkholderia TaxID=32008 RepID=UPI000F5E2200|nr:MULTISPECIES: hypothetical protein [Burkholderia]MCA8240817.1 hypothetical protein [Burkholderia sp. AU32262]